MTGEFLVRNNITQEKERNKYNFYKSIEKYFKDINVSDITREYFINMFKDIGFKSTQTFFVSKSLIVTFVRWAIESGYMTSNNLNDLESVFFEDIEDLSLIKETYVSSVEELIEIIDNQNEDTEKYDTLKCACILCWYGIKPKDVVDIEKMDINADGIIFGEKEYKIDNRNAMSFILEYKNADSYTSDNFGREAEIPYLKSIYLLRTYKNDHLEYKQIRTNVSLLSKRIKNKSLSLGKIYESGIFYRMTEYEKENGIIRPKDYKKVCDYFGIKVNMKGASNKIRDYNRWKKTFHENLLDK